MFVIRLPNGNLMVPQTATGHDGRVLGDVYVEIGPQDADYSRLAELPFRIKEKLADGLDAIFIGPGGVPELDDMTSLHGVPLPSGQATWDACAGAYGERKIVVGSRPSPTPDVMCHEVGHALDDLDSPPGQWQSDSAEFRMLYDQCESHFASDFHRQPGGLGRKEFFADAFAAIACGGGTLVAASHWRHRIFSSGPQCCRPSPASGSPRGRGAANGSASALGSCATCALAAPGPNTGTPGRQAAWPAVA